MKTRNKQKNISSGFTLIELMVATSIFVVIMLASMGSLFTLLDASKNSRALRTAMDNVNFAMESMTRSIRMGTNYYCVTYPTSIGSADYLTEGRNCPSGGTAVSFLPQTVTTYRVGYQWKPRDDAQGTYTLQRCDINSCVDIISPDVNIEQLKFFVKGSQSGDNIQASVYIIMRGTVTIKGVDTSFALQTMASQRNF